jgi:hypothetical protein
MVMMVLRYPGNFTHLSLSNAPDIMATLTNTEMSGYFCFDVDLCEKEYKDQI